MSDIIEFNPQILGGKLVIKGTRIPVELISELIGLYYSLNEIMEEYPSLDRLILIKILELGRDAQKNLSNINLKNLLGEEVHWNLKFLLDENVPQSINNVITNLGYNVKILKDFNKMGSIYGEVGEIAII